VIRVAARARTLTTVVPATGRNDFPRKRERR
jgi:hypothetical protein